MRILDSGVSTGNEIVFYCIWLFCLYYKIVSDNLRILKILDFQTNRTKKLKIIKENKRTNLAEKKSSFIIKEHKRTNSKRTNANPGTAAVAHLLKPSYPSQLPPQDSIS